MLLGSRKMMTSSSLRVRVKTLKQFAAKAGVSHGEAGGLLASLLPSVIDQLTPQGQLPSGGLGDVASIMEMLGGRKG